LPPKSTKFITHPPCFHYYLQVIEPHSNTYEITFGGGSFHIASMPLHPASITISEGWGSASICLVVGSGGRGFVIVLYSYVRKSESVRWECGAGVLNG
jgi:hypothetical protein